MNTFVILKKEKPPRMNEGAHYQVVTYYLVPALMSQLLSLNTSMTDALPLVRQLSNYSGLS